jgi:hypothetical protein
MSAANAISGHLRAWLQDGTPEDDFVSLAVLSDGSYGISPGIVYSFPIQCKGDGTFNIVQVRSLSLTSRPVLRALACLHTTLATLAHARTTPTFTLSQLERFLHSCCCHPSPRRRIFSLVLSAHLLFFCCCCAILSLLCIFYAMFRPQGLTISKETMEAMKLSEAELLQEKADADDIVGGGSA